MNWGPGKNPRPVRNDVPSADGQARSAGVSPGDDATTGQGRPVNALEFRPVPPAVRASIATGRQPLTTVDCGNRSYRVHLAVTKNALVIDSVGPEGEIRSGLLALEDLVHFVRAAEGD